MYNIYTSNRLENLCEKLAATVSGPDLNVFAKELFVTQSAGMSGWLKTELAERNGILANFEFQNQDGLFGAVCELLLGERLRNNTDNIKYGIYRLLDGNDFKTVFPEVAEYYNGNELRRFQLAAKTADLFDQYQLYRNGMIQDLANGNLSTDNPAEQWQSWLWKKLNIESRLSIRKRITEKMKTDSELIKKNFPRISLFGITIFTEFHLEFYRELAEVTSVDFYICLPTDSREFQNELLGSFGSKAAELANMIRKVLGEFNYESHENRGDTLLGRIQDGIAADSVNLTFTTDDSIQVNNCFTPVREVECLYNYLLDLFVKDRATNKENAKKQLKPGDILVMVTDLNKYAPYIKAVFKNAPVKIPYMISGAASNSEDTVTAALEQIMSFTEDDLTSEKVMGLLENRRIKQRFGIRDCDYIRSALNRANIRFGRENREEDDTLYVSWRYGLDKMLLGYAMLTDDDYDNKFPFRDAEATAGHDLLRLRAFFDNLCFVIDEQAKQRTLAEWKRFLFEDVIEKCIGHDDFSKDDRQEISSIYRALSFTDKLDYNDEVPFAVFLEELKKNLFTESVVSKPNSGNVTISSPVPVRGLPCRVICFIGLNNDIFPGKDHFMGFDLLGEEYLEGDRSRKETDKYLFLDTLLSAREKLYLSYIGQSVKNNKEIPPSIVIDVLEEYTGSEINVVKHPLQGFSSAYSDNNNRLFTYFFNDDERPFDPGDNKNSEISELSVYTFVSFFEHPVEWYFRTILKIKFDEPDDILPETELFALDHLQKWLIKDDLLRVPDENLPQYLLKGMKEGYLPLKNSGRVHLDDLVKETAGLKASYLNLVNNREEKSVVIDLTIKDIPIKGIINSVYGDEFIAYSFSDNKKHLLRARLKTLLLSAAGKISSASFLDRYGQVSTMEVPDPLTALSLLETLMDYVVCGSDTPLKFTLKVAEEAVKAAATPEKVFTAFRKEAEGNSYSGEEPDPYVRILYDEGYFNGINEDDIGRIRNLAALLNLITN